MFSKDPNREIDRLKLKLLSLPSPVPRQLFKGIEDAYWQLFNELQKPQYEKDILRIEFEAVAKLMAQTQKKIKG